MKDNPDTDKERISIDDNKRRIIMIRMRKECVVYLNVASTRPLELVPRRPPALKEENFKTLIPLLMREDIIFFRTL